MTLGLATRSAPQRVDVASAVGQPTLYTIHLSQGRTLQVYLDPGHAGANEAHSTFFDQAGTELSVGQAMVCMTPEGGVPAALPVRELEPGHFVADAALRRGRYRFDIEGAMSTGERLSAHLSVDVGS